MKLLPASSLVLLAKLAAANNGYTSTCTSDGFLEITIPYAHEGSANLLSAVAQDCMLSGPESENHSFNWQNNQAVLSINIAACGMDEIYHESKLRQGDYYMATANVTLGIHDAEQNRDLIFYNALLGAECGTKMDYTVTFDYAEKIEKHREDTCHPNSPEGECIVAAYDSYNFDFNEYTSDNYDEELIHFGEKRHKANDMIYLQIEALDLPDDKKFAVKKCDFVDTVIVDGVETTERYPMFNAASGACSNRYIDLAFGYNTPHASHATARISHRLFLLSRGDQDSYSLECDLKVCNKNDHDSDCNLLASCLDFIEDHKAYACDGACQDGEICAVNNDQAICT
jgi:hypothetical protein